MNSIKVEYKVTTIYINSENSKTSYPYKALLNLSDKVNFKRNHKYVVLSNLSMYYTWKIWESRRKFKISAPRWNDEFELADGSYSILNIKHNPRYETVTDMPPVRI